MSESTTSYRSLLQELTETISEEEAQAAVEMVHCMRLEGGSRMGLLGDFMGITLVEKEPGHARCQVEVVKKLFNPYGTLHGGVVFALIDYAMGAALSGTLQEGELSATIEIKVNYLSVVTSGYLHGEAKVLHRGSRVAMLESRVTSDQGRLAAVATGSFYILR